MAISVKATRRPDASWRAAVVTLARFWAANDASIWLTRASSQTSSSRTCSPIGTSVDIRRPSSHRSSMNAIGQESENVRSEYPGGCALGSAASRRGPGFAERKPERTADHVLDRREAETPGEVRGRIVIAGPGRHLVHAPQLAATGAVGHPFGRRHEGAADAAPPSLGPHGDTDIGDVAVLPAVHRQIGDADHQAVRRRGRQAPVLFGTTIVERHGQPFRVLPTRPVGPSLLVGDTHHGEPGVEGLPVVWIDLHDVHRHRCGTSSFCQNVPVATTTKPNRSLTAIMGVFPRALLVLIRVTSGRVDGRASRLASLTASPNR